MFDKRTSCVLQHIATLFVTTYCRGLLIRLFQSAAYLI